MQQCKKLLKWRFCEHNKSFGGCPNGRKETLVPKVVSSYPHLAVKFLLLFYLFVKPKVWCCFAMMSSTIIFIPGCLSGNSSEWWQISKWCLFGGVSTEGLPNECRVMHIQQICHSTFMTLTKETLRWFATPEPFLFKIKRKKTSIGLNEFIEKEKISIQKSCHRI